MNPKLIRKERFKVVGYSINTSTKDAKNLVDIPSFWDAYLTDGRMEKLHNEKFIIYHDEYGICLPMDSEGNFKYLIGVLVNEEVNNNYDSYVINEQLYLIFTTPKANEQNFSKSIQETWNQIFKEWLPNSNYEYDSSGLEFELYDDRSYGSIDKEMDIYIPVKEKRLE